MSTHAALDDPRRVGALSVPAPGVQALLAVGLAAMICAVAAVADGGLQLGRTTPALLGMIVVGGGAVCGAVLLAPHRRRLWGLGPLALLFALAALTALSITWAASPSEAWLETNRTLAYCAVFAAAVALAHSVPGRWGALLGAITLSAVALSAYAVLTKIVPGALSPDEIYARLREPFGYWNSVGLAAALGVPGCLWLGTRRAGHQALNALAYPALGLLTLTLLLSFSRGAVLAALLGAACWLAVVPRRLRGTAVLLAGAAGGGLVAAWAFSQDALTDDRVPLDLREQAGAQLGVLVVAMLALLAVAGLAIGFAVAAQPPSARTRRRAGVALLAALALAGVGGIVALSLGERGLTGSISARWHELTDPDARLPRNDNSRLISAGSERARYWDEALRIFRDNPGVGVGAGGYAIVRKRYRKTDPAVRQAHGYVPQTLADLGLAGLGASLALLAAWLASTLRATGLRRRDRGRPYTPERVGLLTLLAVVVVFGVHSAVDWTWLVPANAAVALLAAGWLAGRGPLAGRADPPPHGAGMRLAERVRAGIAERPRAVAATIVALLTLVTAWTAWQPLRADDATQDALAALDAGHVDAAREQARHAHAVDPLALEPLYALSTIETAAKRKSAALRALQDGVRLQPANPDPWIRLAQFELDTLGRPKDALRSIRPAIYLDPRSSDAVAVFLAAQRQAKTP